jgi:hypothetical protein
MGSKNPPDGVPWEQCRPLNNPEASKFNRREMPYAFEKWPRRRWMESFMEYMTGVFDPDEAIRLRDANIEWLCDKLYRERVILYRVREGRFSLVIDKLTWMAFCK